MPYIGWLEVVNICNTDCPPATSIHHIQVQRSSESTPAHEQWDPLIDLTHLDEQQRQLDLQI